MRIATWNVERLKHIKQLDTIIEECAHTQADILVLTETDTKISLPYRNCLYTAPLPTPFYKETERRVAVYTDYEVFDVMPTYDDLTALCVDLKTNNGIISVYGTIIGAYGRHSFKDDLRSQVKDIQSLCKSKKNICICGDLNCSFSDNYYFTYEGRASLLQIFEENNITLLTESLSQCIDHIAVSSELCGSSVVSITEWNKDKRLSDHKGVVVSI